MTLSVAALPAHAAPAQTPANIVLTPGVPILIGADEPVPVQRAVQDLRRDLQSVLGAPSPLARTTAELRGRAAIVVTSGHSAATRDYDLGVTGREAHAIGAIPAKSVVVLAGADMRGTIYAIYAFSDRFLNVPPLWIFAGWTPPHQSSISVPADTDVRVGSPSVRFRTWFPNDTDMIVPWMNRSPENFDALFETMLRLGFNTLDVDSFCDVPAPDRGLLWPRHCGERGIIVTTTHIAPLGARWKYWDAVWRDGLKQEPPAKLLANNAKFEEFWAYFIRLAQREGFEMLWQITFRGDNDHALIETFPNAPRDAKDSAPFVGEMMRREVALLQRETGQIDPPMRATMFDEVAVMVASGHHNRRPIPA